MAKTLVAYFSASGATKKLAQNLALATDADIYEIKPVKPYTQADLDWTDKNSRSSVEMRDKNYRPEIIDDDFSVQNYDKVFLGFPIWWYIAPTIVNTFLEKHDFSGKKIVLFATSGGSRFGKTSESIKVSVSPETEVIEGSVLSPISSTEDLRKWAEQF